MNQYLHLTTLGVKYFDRSLRFYSQILGWEAACASIGDAALFQAGRVVFAIYPFEKLAEDAITPRRGSGFSAIILAYYARSETEVDEIIRNLKAKRVQINKEPRLVFWGGYSSYFADPDGFLWEVTYNLFFRSDEYGNLKPE
jgi:uncharacterized protein